MWLNIDEEFVRDVVKALREAGENERAERLESDVERLQMGPEHEPYLQAAKELYEQDGEVEFDSDAVVSLGEDPGAYVMCWRWVSNDEAGMEQEATDALFGLYEDEDEVVSRAEQYEEELADAHSQERNDG